MRYYRLQCYDLALIALLGRMFSRWSCKRKKYFPQPSSPAWRVSMRWININDSQSTQWIQYWVVQSGKFGGIWWIFGIRTTSFCSFFSASVIVSGVVMFVAGFVVSAAFACLLSMLCGRSTRSSSKFHRSLFWSLPSSAVENKEHLHRKRVFFRSTTISYSFTNWCQKKLLQHMKLLYCKTVIF